MEVVFGEMVILDMVKLEKGFYEKLMIFNSGCVVYKLDGKVFVLDFSCYEFVK